MTNYEKCIEAEQIKKLVTPEALCDAGVELCQDCRYFPSGPDGGCNAPEEYSCENRVAEWLEEPYSGWAKE
jgi:hypothetical protein